MIFLLYPDHFPFYFEFYHQTRSKLFQDFELSLPLPFRFTSYSAVTLPFFDAFILQYPGLVKRIKRVGKAESALCRCPGKDVVICILKRGRGIRTKFKCGLGNTTSLLGKKDYVLKCNLADFI
ncbi:hypothetical protein APR41_14040 [Salegentibacter salinarum]|uniref:Uncharacterized protein n=1 Tax=Salegentibacter salinarum TaxID=447422 RepID=A0A2N0U066_9FLAO|nr:hypothetical protein APR41_14040 [Salegentibacter salinarum]